MRNQFPTFLKVARKIKHGSKKITKKQIALGFSLILIIGTALAAAIILLPKPAIPQELLANPEPGEINVSKELADRDPNVEKYVGQVGGKIVEAGQPIPFEYSLTAISGKTQQEVTDYLNENGITLIKYSSQLGIYWVRFPESFDLKTLDQNIVSIGTQNHTVVVSSDDPLFSTQWALPIMDIPTVWDHIPEIDKAWHKLTIAVIDTGSCPNHPDLQGIFLNGGYDYVDMDTDPTDPGNGHGCLVSGVIAATTNNKIGIAGATPNVNILSYRAMNEFGFGSSLGVAMSIIDAADANVGIINLSLGSMYDVPEKKAAIAYAISKGVIVVASAGNDSSSDPTYPAAYDGVIAVGSIDKNGKRSWFSNFGSYVDVWAPGSSIVSTSLDGKYKTVSGTSFASPYVAGLIALERMFCRNVTLSGNAKAQPDLPFDLESCYPNTAAPVFTSTPVTTATEGAAFAYTITASDADNDPITFKLNFGPDGMTLAGNVLTWPSPTVAQHLVTIVASDGRTATEQKFELTVSPKPVTPKPVLKTPRAPSIFKNAQAEYNTWWPGAQKQGLGCAATVVQVESNTPQNNFEVWFCTQLSDGSSLALQILEDQNRKEVDRIPVKYTVSCNNWSTRIQYPNGYMSGCKEMMDILVTLGMP